jgi:CIC family chloride channel protein
MASKLSKFIQYISKKNNDLLVKANLTEHTFMIIIAIIIGALAGFSAIIIRALIEWITDISFLGHGSILQNITDSPWYIILFVPALGGLIVGPIIYFFAPEAKGHGVPEVMQAIFLKGGKIRPRVALIKAFASAVSIGTGGSVGREGPIVQIGSSLGSTIGQFFKVPTKRMKTLVGCGAAAGIAAAFNAPIAGALFALEIILMDFAVAQFSPIVISSVMATVVSRAFEGDFAAFKVPHYELVSPQELVFYLILGIFAGVVSYFFIKVLYSFEDWFDAQEKIPEYYRPVIGGLGVGLIGLLAPEVMGVGYDTINFSLNGNIVWYFALILVFIKILATAVTLGSGGSGGIFAPSLFMGATLGASFGAAVHLLFPAITATPGAYALVAMGGLVAGTTRAPITAIIIVFELTNDYHIILPLMITTIISTIISSYFTRESIYTLKLVRRGINIKDGSEVNVMKSIFIRDIYDSDFVAIHPEDKFNTVVRKVVQSHGQEFPVLKDNGEIIGTISVETIKDFLFENDELQEVLVAADVYEPKYETVSLDDNSNLAMEKMRKYDWESLPVTDSENSKKVIGVVHIKDIQDAYYKAIERIDLADSFASSIRKTDEGDELHFMEGYSVLQIHVPKQFVGKSIKELNIRARFGVDILSVKTVSKKSAQIKAIPSPDYVFQENDSIILAGEVKNINKIKILD